MQNVDYYSGPGSHTTMPDFDRVGHDFYDRPDHWSAIDPEASRKKASRMLFIICAFCIVSFTTGLVIGIKFAGGSERNLVDPRTSQAMSDLGSTVTRLVGKEKPAASELFPRSDFPWVVRVGSDYSREESRKLAEFLSAKGHTVILSRNGDKYRIYTGPFKSRDDAQKNVDELSAYRQYSLASETKILKR